MSTLTAWEKIIKSASNELTIQKRYKYVIYFTDKIWLSYLFVKYGRLKTFQSPLVHTYIHKADVFSRIKVDSQSKSDFLGHVSATVFENDGWTREKIKAEQRKDPDLTPIIDRLTKKEADRSNMQLHEPLSNFSRVQMGCCIMSPLKIQKLVHS